MEFVPLGDHLGASQEVIPARMKAGQQALEVVPPTHGVAIHAPDARSGKDLRQALFALLRSRAEVIQVLAVALGTTRRHLARVPAVVALHTLALAGDLGLIGGRLVMGERNGAILAFKLF